MELPNDATNKVIQHSNAMNHAVGKVVKKTN